MSYEQYGDSALEAWLRHVEWAVGRNELPYSLKVAEKEFPILKDAREALSPEDYRALVGTLAPRYRASVRVPQPEETP